MKKVLTLVAVLMLALSFGCDDKKGAEGGGDKAESGEIKDLVAWAEKAASDACRCKDRKCAVEYAKQLNQAPGSSKTGKLYQALDDAGKKMVDEAAKRAGECRDKLE